MENLLKRIMINDNICNGKPIIRGCRISVQTIMEFILSGTPEDEILKQYPILEKEDIEACKEFTLILLNKEYIIKGIAA